MRRPDTTFLLLLVMLPAASAACSSAKSGTRDGGSGAGGTTGNDAVARADPTTAMGFCLDFFALVTDAFVRCDDLSNAVAERIFGNPIFCQRFVASVTAGRVRFDGSMGRACLDSLATGLTCDDSMSTAMSTAMQAAACAPVLTPVLTAGATCSSIYLINVSDECLGDDVYCKEGDNYACTGVCTASAPIGAACDSLADIRCVHGASCVGKVCVATAAPLGADQPCTGQSTCASNLFCDTSSSDGGAAGLCHAKRSSGACTSDATCAKPTHCIGPSGGRTCTSYQAVGGPCTPGTGQCDPFSHCTPAGTCSDAFASIGQPCGTLAGESVACDEGAYCDAPLLMPGVCRA